MSKLLDDSDEKKITFLKDLKDLFDGDGEEGEISLYEKGVQEVHDAGDEECRPTLLVIEKYMQELGFYAKDVIVLSSIGPIDFFFKNYSPRDMALVITYLHCGLVLKKVLKLPEILRIGKDEKIPENKKKKKLSPAEERAMKAKHHEESKQARTKSILVNC